MYSAKVLDHFQRPRHSGTVAEPDASVQLENPVCGDVLKLTLRVSGGQIAEIRFLAKGCVATMACGSALAELAMGMSVEKARQLSCEDLVDMVVSLPPASKHASHLALDALHAALDQLEDKR